MECSIDCVYCYLKQAVSAMKSANVDEDTQHVIIYQLMDYVKGFDRTKTPAENSSLVLHKVSELIGAKDPFEKEKKSSNDLALSIYPFAKDIVSKSSDPLYEALKIAVAGNIIDLGIQRSFDIEGELANCITNGFARNDYEYFCHKLKQVDEVMILGDNAGEIVFDKILVEELLNAGKKVIYSVKKGPILNDSTIEDAIYVGMDRCAKVITTGSNFLGISFDNVSEEFMEYLEKSGLIISKGQANFESLEHIEEYNNKIFFMLKIKCEYVGSVANSAFGDVVFFNKRLL